jgi:hypothetical protein
VKRAAFQQEKVSSSDYSSRTPSYYLEKIEPHILKSFNPEQLQAMASVLEQAIPKPSPKLVDLRFVVDLVFSRFYIVLFVGKDRRKRQRKYTTEGIAKVGNIIAAVILLIGINLVVSAFILLFAYLFKSAIGIDLLPGHISETLKKILR